MASLITIANTRPWREIPREEQRLVLHQLQKQMSVIASQLAMDVTTELHRNGVPVTFTVKFEMIIDPERNPFNDG